MRRRLAWWERRDSLKLEHPEDFVRLREDASALLRACAAWAENGWCVQGPKPKPGCECDWHLAKAAVDAATAPDPRA